MIAHLTWWFWLGIALEGVVVLLMFGVMLIHASVKREEFQALREWKHYYVRRADDRYTWTPNSRKPPYFDEVEI